MFVVEQAHWYYEDHCRDADGSLPSLSLRAFAHALAAHCPDAFSAAFGRRGGGGNQNQALIHDIDAAMAQFNAFKAQVPTAGAALLDPTLTKVLMVKGYKKDASWGFPRGKLSRGETAAECAAREVLEETGIDISGFVDDISCPRIEVSVNAQATTLFVVAGAASEETPVAALVRGEIGDIAWHLLADLPATREAGMLTYKTATGVKHRFWRVREEEVVFLSLIFFFFSFFFRPLEIKKLKTLFCFYLSIASNFLSSQKQIDRSGPTSSPCGGGLNRSKRAAHEEEEEVEAGSEERQQNQRRRQRRSESLRRKRASRVAPWTLLLLPPQALRRRNRQRLLPRGRKARTGRSSNSARGRGGPRRPRPRPSTSPWRRQRRQSRSPGQHGWSSPSTGPRSSRRCGASGRNDDFVIDTWSKRKKEKEDFTHIAAVGE